MQIISQLEQEINFAKITHGEGYYYAINNKLTKRNDNFSLTYLLIPCQPFQTFYFYSRSGYSMPCAIALAENKIDVIKTFGESKENPNSLFEIHQSLITIPVGSSYILFQSAVHLEDENNTNEIFQIEKINEDSYIKGSLGGEARGYLGKDDTKNSISYNDNETFCYCTSIKKVNKGDIYYYKGICGNNAPALFLYSENKELIKSLTPPIFTEYSFIFEVPENVRYIKAQSLSLLDDLVNQIFTFKELSSIPYNLSNFLKKTTNYINIDYSKIVQTADLDIINSPIISCKEGDNFVFEGEAINSAAAIYYFGY